MKKFFYRVKSSETVYLISQKYCAPTLSIVAKNNLFREVEEGDVLYIEGEQNTYKVDFLEDYDIIAKRLGVSVEYLKSINASTPYLFYGLVIKI